MNSLTSKDISMMNDVCSVFNLDTKKVFPKDFKLLLALNIYDVFGEMPDQETQDKIDEMMNR